MLAVLEPAPGAMVAGAVPVRVRGDRAEISRDGKDWKKLPDGLWDTATVPDGRCLLRAVGGGSASEPVAVVVDNGAPKVSLVAPSAGDAVDGSVVLRAEVDDAGSGVGRVEFMLSNGSPDWQAVAEVSPPDLEAKWDARGVEPGTYWLCAIATDRAGNAAASAPVPVVVGG